MKQTRRAQCGCAGLAASALVVAAILAGTWTAAPALGAVRDVLVAAEHRAEAIGDRFQRTWARYTIGQAWQRIDPAHAAELADRLESWPAKRDLLTEVMFAWGQIDPQAAGHWGIEFKARTPGDLVRRNTALHYAVVGMVTKNPKLADELIWKHLGEEGWGGKPRTAPMAAAIELAKVDPPAALAMAEKITNHEESRISALRGVLRAWAGQDPAAARAAFEGRPELEFRKTFPRDLAEGWARKAPQAAAAYAQTIADRPTKMMALALVARELARSEPRGAAELCRASAVLDVGAWHEQRPRLGKIVAEVGHAYAAADLEAAIAWAENLPATEGGGRANAADGVAAAWAERDPDAALEYYSGTKAGANSADAKRTGEVKPLGTGAAYPAIARQLAKRDATQAVGLVSATKSLVLKSHIVYEVAVELAARDPAAAGELIEKWAGVVDYYTYRAGAAAVVAEAWARQSPERAAAWAEKLAPELDRAAALRGAAHGWGQRSVAEALAWAAAIRNPQDAVPALVGVAEAELPHPL